MGIKTFNPYTPSRRHMTGSDFSEITKTTPEKSLLTSLKKSAGRNNQGKITVRHHGGGEKRKYRLIDFKRIKEITGNDYNSSFNFYNKCKKDDISITKEAPNYSVDQ